MLKTEYHRAKSATRPRDKNPIIPHEQPVVIEKPGRAKVDQSFFYSKYPSERPKGKSRNEISDKSKGTFSVNSNENITHRPCIKVSFQPNPISSYERPQSIRVLGYDSTKNPVIQERTASRPRTRGSPSPILKYENERKNFLPADLGLRSGWGQTTSKVFEENPPCYLFGGKVKSVKNQECEIRNVIEYEFALPFREQKVTSKP
jgi:hypothetical protein